MAEAPSPDPDRHIEIVLVGKVGCGKSSSGNTILGRKAFRTSAGFSTETMTCERVIGRVYGRQIALVDTPGLNCEGVSPAELFRQIEQITDIIDVFLLVIQLGRFTGEQRAAVQKMEDMFGERAREQTMILFTYGDELNYSIEDYIYRAGDPLGQVVHKYGGRYHVFNNKSQHGSQVRELLEKMERMKQTEQKCERLISVERQLGDLQKLLDMIENIRKGLAISHRNARNAALPMHLGAIISCAVGALLVPVTLGTSLILTGVGVGLMTAGVAVETTSTSLSLTKQSAFIKDTEKCLDESRKVFVEFNNYSEATEYLGYISVTLLSDIAFILEDVKKLLKAKIRKNKSRSKLFKDIENGIRNCKEHLDDIDKQIKMELRRMRSLNV